MWKKTMVVVPAVAALALATPAFAAPPYNVIVGGDDTPRDVPITGVASPIDFIAVGDPADPADDVPMNCVSSTATGVVHAGPRSGVDPEQLATLDGSQWGTCSGPLGLQMTVEHRGEWHLNTQDPNVTGPPVADTDIVGWIDHVEAYVYATNAPESCAFLVTGAVDGSFDEVSQILSVNEDGTMADSHMLTLTDADDTSDGSTCFGLIENGDNASFFGDYDVTTDEGAIDVTDGA